MTAFVHTLKIRSAIAAVLIAARATFSSGCDGRSGKGPLGRGNNSSAGRGVGNVNAGARSHITNSINHLSSTAPLPALATTIAAMTAVSVVLASLGIIDSIGDSGYDGYGVKANGDDAAKSDGIGNNRGNGIGHSLSGSTTDNIIDSQQQ